MSRPILRTVLLVALAAGVGALAACDVKAPPPLYPSLPPMTATLPNSSGSGSLLSFRDDFEASSLNESVWAAFPQTGQILVRGGQVEMLNTGKQPNFPYLVTKSGIIPQAGPWYFETNITFLLFGAVHFGLDYLPAEQPGQEPLTRPFLLASVGRGKVAFQADVEGNKDVSGISTDSLDTNQSYTLRVENDGSNHYRVIFNGKEVLVFESTRRPSRFWVGQNPPKDVPAQVWPRVLIDYVASGVLAAPASAEPYVAPTPRPTPTPRPKATPTPTPEATPTPEEAATDAVQP